MEVALVGKPNCGKSTFFKAATLIDVAIAPYPFTTIKPNIGMTFVRVNCVDKELGLQCNPRSGYCKNNQRFVSTKIIDVAGLVPGAHQGKGLGNEFLNDLSRAHAFVHIVDASGTTDAEGKATTDWDPVTDVKFLEEELDHWIAGILQRNWKVIERDAKTKELVDVLADKLSGLSISRPQISKVLDSVTPHADNLLVFARELRSVSKPLVIAANKIDVPGAEKNLRRLEDAFPSYKIVPVSSESELALRKAAEAKVIEYLPGDSKFKLAGSATDRQKEALKHIELHILDKYGSTGVQAVINHAAFQLLGLLPVYPVEDETHFADSKGNVLPDVHLLPPGSTPKELAYAIHSQIGDAFSFAVDARTKMRVGAAHILKANDVIKVVTGHR